jgi:hypothetical protein
MVKKTTQQDIPYTILIHLVNTRTEYLQIKIKIFTNNGKLAAINESILTLVCKLQNR